MGTVAPEEAGAIGGTGKYTPLRKFILSNQILFF